MTATPRTSPKFMSAEYFRKSVDESKGISGTVTGPAPVAATRPRQALAARSATGRAREDHDDQQRGHGNEPERFITTPA